jgi:hypothetical protein
VQHHIRRPNNKQDDINILHPCANFFMRVHATQLSRQGLLIFLSRGLHLSALPHLQ